MWCGMVVHDKSGTGSDCEHLLNCSWRKPNCKISTKIIRNSSGSHGMFSILGTAQVSTAAVINLSNSVS
jgi:hypothetical protein